MEEDETLSVACFGTTQKGRELLAKMLAGETLMISKVVAGSGALGEGETLDGLTDLVKPMMEGTSTEPEYLKDVMSMTLEFRSDLSTEKDFFVKEYGVFALDPKVGEVLLYYGNLGDQPQLMTGTGGKYTSVLDFHVSITIGEDLAGVELGYPAAAFLLKEELTSHQEDPKAHEVLFSGRLQLAVQEEKPEGSGIFLWIDPSQWEEEFSYLSPVPKDDEE